ncbi:MAG TPA: hypothetical protein IAD42_00115 [Candidatus Scatomorpha pullistercoris]|uniref:Peptidase M56 domain-containing protein n=1 Tax=Candidatus Scatomorpha pullistercoris TaxID=2840929 RepID=A0A9D1G2X6_9FIRM|nr:hypothetical protein [Candidatus Scatomorpha pullistercoris]
MAEVFQKVLNMSIAASWLILAVIVLRFLLKRAPKRYTLLLWAVVGLRLALPWSIESALSLIPSAATLPEGIMLARSPALDTGIEALNEAKPGFCRGLCAPARGERKPAASAAAGRVNDMARGHGRPAHLGAGQLAEAESADADGGAARGERLRV